MDKNNGILLGDEVQCIYTGVKGVVLSKTEFINGCVQFAVAQKFDPKKKIEEAIAEINIDSQSLKILKKGDGHKKKIVDEDDSVGGAMRVVYRR